MLDWLSKNLLRYDQDFQTLTIKQAWELELPLNDILTTQFYTVTSGISTNSRWLTHTIECKLCKQEITIPSLSPRSIVDIYLILLESFIKCHWGCKTDMDGKHFEFKECFSCHTSGFDGIKATKKMVFSTPSSIIKNCNIDLCDKCYEIRSKQKL